MKIHKLPNWCCTSISNHILAVQLFWLSTCNECKLHLLCCVCVAVICFIVEIQVDSKPPEQKHYLHAQTTFLSCKEILSQQQLLNSHIQSLCHPGIKVQQPSTCFCLSQFLIEHLSSSNQETQLMINLHQPSKNRDCCIIGCAVSQHIILKPSSVLLAVRKHSLFQDDLWNWSRFWDSTSA